jgi:subtilisin
LEEKMSRASLLALFVVLFALPVKPLRAQPERVEVLIGFPDRPGQSDEALVHAAGGRVRYRYHLVNAIAASVPLAALEGLSRNPRVSVIEPDGQVQAFDLELDNAWGVARIGAGLVHQSGNRGDGVRVAIVDSGIDCTHPDLGANCAGGIDLVNDDNDPMDDNGHGTHVAGTVAAQDDESGVVGVAPRALLYGIKVLGANGNGSWSDIVAGIEWAADHGIQVTNNSYGSNGDPGTIVRAAFDNSYAAGMVHVASAGNSGNCPGSKDSVGYPARYDSVIAVAAVDANDARPCFSSAGLKVELAAPGVGIYSTQRGGGYTTMSGTSMASPHAAGVAALVLAAGASSPQEVRLRLVTTADDLGASGRDKLYGFGLVDADEAAAESPVNAAPTVVVTAPSSGSRFDSGSSILLHGSASDPEDGDLSLAITWTSNLDGALGSGGSVSASLSDGVHTVTAQVTDSENLTATDSVTVTVETAATTAWVRSIEYLLYGGKSQDRSLAVVATVVDDLGRTVSGATVTLRISSTSLSETLSGVTDASGRARMDLRRAPSGCYRSVVENVVASGLVWDGATPANELCK